ncbi:hypothetical protein B0T18DRAFT_388838 [Schizothecium vesticola]|uniref:Uncharacterized protein n=1 Tax=Schizothecium vesticola TaxID=314040 RepID=A0AA40K7U4_9PEZI|nr:hypothetical protein B0T18DRAFT_388838 [Schizothecium vesticola]
MSQAAPAATAPTVDARTVPTDAAAVGSATPSPPIPAAAALVSPAASPSRTPPSTVPSPPRAPPAAPAACSPAPPAACPSGPVRASRRRRCRQRDPPYYVYRWTEAGRLGIGLVPGTAAYEYWLMACRIDELRRALNVRRMAAAADVCFAAAPGEREEREERFDAGRASFGGGDEEVVSCFFATSTTITTITAITTTTTLAGDDGIVVTRNPPGWHAILWDTGSCPGYPACTDNDGDWVRAGRDTNIAFGLELDCHSIFHCST